MSKATEVLLQPDDNKEVVIDIESQSSQSVLCLCENQVDYSQHEDPDVVIPDLNARPLVVSSHLLLVTAIVAAVYQFWILFAVNLFVYITSVLHWRRPRFSTCERKLDYTAVLTNIIYGTIFSMSLNTLEYKIVWFAGLFLIGVLFCINEVIYYI